MFAVLDQMRAVYHSFAALPARRVNLAHPTPWGETMPSVNIGNRSKACFEASCWVNTDTRQNSGAAASNTFISTGCCRCDLPVYHTVCYLSSSIPPSHPHCFFYLMWIVFLLLCTDVVLSCAVIVCKLTITRVQKKEHYQAFTEYVFPFFFLFCTWALCALNCFPEHQRLCKNPFSRTIVLRKQICSQTAPIYTSIEGISSISTHICEMLHRWINNGSSFQVRLWTALKFLTPWKLETATVSQFINLLFQPYPLLLSPSTPPPTVSLWNNAPYCVFFHQGEVSVSHRHKDLSHKCTNIHRSMRAFKTVHYCSEPYDRLFTFVVWLRGPIRGRFFGNDTRHSCVLQNPFICVLTSTFVILTSDTWD